MDCSIYYGRHVSPERLIGPYEVDLLNRLAIKPARAWRRHSGGPARRPGSSTCRAWAWAGDRPQRRALLHNVET